MTTGVTPDAFMVRSASSYAPHPEVFIHFPTHTCPRAGVAPADLRSPRPVASTPHESALARGSASTRPQARSPTAAVRVALAVTIFAHAPTLDAKSDRAVRADARPAAAANHVKDDGQRPAGRAAPSSFIVRSE